MTVTAATEITMAPSTLAAGVHPAMPVPFDLLIQNLRFRGRELSVVSGRAVGHPDPELDGQRAIALLQFNFEGFTVSVEADVALHVTEGEEGAELAFTFLDPTGPHLPQLRHILNSFIAGDLVNLGSVLQPSAEARNAPRAGERRTGVARFASGALRGGVTLCLTLGFVWLALALIESRVLTVTEARPAIITMPGEVLRAPSAGQIEFLNPGAGEGDVAFSILSNAGIVLSLKMPCDCDIAEIATFEGATVLAGEPVIRLADTTGAPVISAQLSEESLAAIVSGYRIELHAADGTVIPARLGANAAREITAQSDAGPVPVTLTPVTPLPVSAAGTLLSLRLTRPALVPGLELRTLNDRIAGLFGANAAQAGGVEIAADQR